MSKIESPKGWKIVTYKDNSENTAQPTIKNVTNSKQKKPLIWGDLSTKPYWKRNLLPFIGECAFLISCFSLPGEYLIFSSFLFHTLLFIYFLITKGFTFRQLWRNIKSGFYFWKETLICTLSLSLALGITGALEYFFPNLNPGQFQYPVTNIPGLIIFSITTLFLVPITEETFYRGNLISMETKSMMILTSVSSMLLWAVQYAYTPWGIFLAAIWALTLTWTFIKNRNFYITITSHFIVNLIGNLPVIISIIKTLN